MNHRKVLEAVMLKRLKSLAVASLVACSLTLGGASAFAANNDKAPWDKGAPTTGSLTIEKVKDADPATTKHFTPVPGAEFTVTEVDKVDNQAFDLKTEKGWKELAKKVDALNAGTATATLKDVDAKKMETGQDGTAKFDGLAIGLYKVVESKVPQGYSSDVRPFYITIPQITKGTKAKNPAYTYNVKVQPKNKDVSSSITKTADTSKTVVTGDKISYEIEAGVNKSKESNGNVDLTKADLKGYTIFDDAPNNTYTDLKDGVKKVTVGGTELVKDTDYTIDDKEFTPGTNNASTRLKVKFTDTGLEKIATAVNGTPDVKVKVQLTFTIKPGYDKNEIVNKFGFIPGYNEGKGETPPSPVTPKPDGGVDPNPKTVFRNFQIKKVSAKDSTTPLSGAKFKLFASEDEAKKCAQDPNNADNCKAASTFGEKETNGQGMTDKVKAIVGQTFYAVETHAPTGYARSNQPTTVKILENDANDPYVVTIENVPTSDSGNWFTLPKTGATGVIVFALAGLVLVATGAGLYLFGRKS
ncbi:Fimbrial subunit type 1 precursor [Chlamydia trachomatis]|nr:Fimbrial subunit type 1 precursor [Chlamydia trachomatis]